MGKKTYRKPETTLVDLGINDDLLDSGMVNFSVREDGGYGAAEAKRHIFDEQEDDFFGEQDAESNNSSIDLFSKSF